MKKIIDITGHKLCIFEFDTDKKIKCADTLILNGEIFPYNNGEVFREGSSIVTKTYDIISIGAPQIYDYRLPSCYFTKLPFISGIFELKMKDLQDPITEKLIHYPEIKIQGKDIPIAKNMQDFIFKDNWYDLNKVKQYRTFDEIEFQVYDISNSLFFSLIPFENTKENIKK